jgi:hypothetical protein
MDYAFQLNGADAITFYRNRVIEGDPPVLLAEHHDYDLYIDDDLTQYALPKFINKAFRKATGRAANRVHKRAASALRAQRNLAAKGVSRKRFRQQVIPGMRKVARRRKINQGIAAGGIATGGALVGSRMSPRRRRRQQQTEDYGLKRKMASRLRNLAMGGAKRRRRIQNANARVFRRVLRRAPGPAARQGAREGMREARRLRQRRLMKIGAGGATVGAALGALEVHERHKRRQQRKDYATTALARRVIRIPGAAPRAKKWVGKRWLGKSAAWAKRNKDTLRKRGIQGAALTAATLPPYYVAKKRAKEGHTKSTIAGGIGSAVWGGPLGLGGYLLGKRAGRKENK